MGLFSASVTEQINQIAAKSNEQAQKAVAVNTRSMNDDLNKMSKQVVEYFKDSPAILITSKQALHEYVDHCIKHGYAGIDTETTGLDRIKDWIVGASLYAPGKPECYIPMKHLVPLFDTPYKDQLSYDDVREEFQRLVDNHVKLIFANADYDLAMIYKDLKVDMVPAFYYDVITAWRCLREDEKDNTLKGLYAKYPMRGSVDPKKFSDFFSPKLFPYCKPQIAKLYAANDAKITYELYIWQLPYVTKNHPKCRKNHLEKIADLIWHIEFPMVAICAHLHRRGVYLDNTIASTLHERYTAALNADKAKLAECVQELIDTKDIATNRNRPFRTGYDFNCNSNPHVKYLINALLGSTAKTTSKEVLKEINSPATKAVLRVRGDVKLLSTYVDKLPRATAKDNRIHASFKSVGADTGRMSCIEGSQLVVTDSGYVPISKIEPGQSVYCLDENGEARLSRVVDKQLTGHRKCIKVKYEDENGCKDEFICTPEHPVRANNFEWVQAVKLEPGQHLYKLDMKAVEYKFLDQHASILNRVKVTGIEELGEYDVYDITVKDNHNFFVKGVNVHNSYDPNMQNVPSHALDIRHMFRATPEYKEQLKLSENAATLLHCDSIPTLEGLTKVRDLKEGMTIIMKEGRKEVRCQITNITSETLGQSTIHFERIQEG